MGALAMAVRDGEGRLTFMPNGRWTPVMDDQLRRLAPVFSAAEIAEQMRVTRNAVIGRCHRKGIVLSANPARPRVWSPAVEARLRGLALEYTAPQIATILGVSSSAVASHCHRLGISLRGGDVQRLARGERKVKVKREKDLIAPNGSAPSVYVNLAEHREAAMVAPTADWQPKRLSIMDLRANSCRWPLWVGTVPFSEKFYCGNEALPQLSYCQRCHDRSVSAAYIAEAVDRRHAEAARAAA